MAIPFDFGYYKPLKPEEAFKLHRDLRGENKKVLYYAGGTEIISMARMQSIKFDAVIDLKNIYECCVLGFDSGFLTIGSCKTLTEIAKFDAFPLLSKTIKRIADHTIQGKITLGGNLAGTIIYREAALPLMISGARVLVMGEEGIKERAFKEVFDGRLRLNEGEFLVAVKICKEVLNLPFWHVKRTKNLKIDYPLITLAAHEREGVLEAAVSGFGDFPLVLPRGVLNEKGLGAEGKIEKIIKTLRSFCKGDLQGSKEYKEAVLGEVLGEIIR